MWAMPVFAGMLCGIVQGLSNTSSNEMGKLRRFVGGYGSVPVMSAAFTVAAFILIGVVEFASGNSSLNLDALPIGLTLILAFSLFTGVLIGIPVAVVFCKSTTSFRERYTDATT